MRAFILCLSLFSLSAHADFKDGNKLLSDLNDPGVVYPMLGMGYILGIADAYGGVSHCPPPNVTAGQLRDMVTNYLDNTPAVRHLPASTIVAHVLKSTWPCRKGNGV